MLISAVRNSVADDRLGRRSGRCVHPGCLPADCAGADYLMETTSGSDQWESVR